MNHQTTGSVHKSIFFLGRFSGILFIFLQLIGCSGGSGNGTHGQGNDLPRPKIVSVSGSPGGRSANIAGSNFGTKATATPLKWDNFEAGTVGNRIGGNNAVIGGTWSDFSSGSTYPVYNATQVRPNSTRSSYYDYASAYNISLQEIHDNQAEWFFSYWYYTNQADSARQSKPWQMYGSSSDEPMTYMGWGQNGVDGFLRIGMMDAGSSDPNNGAAANQSWYGVGASDIASVRNKWIRIDVYLKQSTGGLTNGEYRVWLSNGTNSTWMSLWRYPTKTRSTSNYWRQLMLGEYFGGGNTTHQVWMDDVYIDSTQARVEICDKSTWTSRTHCEIQIPTTWLDNSITFNVNPGSFTDLRNTYLYVVDSNGNVDSNGYSLAGL